MQQWLDRIETANPDYAPFTAIMRELTEAFLFEDIIHILRHYLGDSHMT